MSERLRRRLRRAVAVAAAAAATAACAPIGPGARVAAAAAAPPARAEVIADLLPLLGSPGSVRLRDASAAEVRRPVPADGVLRDAFFLHPETPGRPATAEVSVSLPRVPRGGRLLLAFDVALSDGIPVGERPGIDGVRFGVDVEERPLYRADWRACRWQPAAVDVTAWAGKRARVTLRADARKTTRYDWALFGAPRLIALTPAPPRDSGGAGEPAPPVCGVAHVAWDAAAGPPARVRLVPEGAAGAPAGEPLEWRPAPGQTGTSAAVDFSFPRARRVRVVADPTGAPSRIALGAYPPAPAVTYVGPTEAVPRAGGAPVPLRVEVRNRGRGLLPPGGAVAQLRARGRLVGSRPVPALGPGEAWRGDWPMPAGREPASVPLEARLVDGRARPLGPSAIRLGRVETFARPEAATEPGGGVREVGNGRLRLQFVRSGGRYAYARVLARPDGSGTWTPVGVLRPLLSLEPAGAGARVEERRTEVRPRTVVVSDSGRTARLSERVTDAAGVPWTVRATFEVDPTRPLARLRYRWTPGRDAAVGALVGPDLYVGDGLPSGAGARKEWALFPGLEYLYRGEPSSSARGFAPPLGDRRTPDPRKVTAPLMAVTLGPHGARPALNPGPYDCPDSLLGPGAPMTYCVAPGAPVTVALWWDPLQKWDGVRGLPSARFGSPNADVPADNHRLALFLPSVPESVPENGERAGEGRPYRAAAGRPLTLEATLWSGPGPALGALGAWLKDRGGLPAPSAPPRPVAETFALARAAYAGAVWNPESRRWRGIVEGGDGTVPAAATLLLLDALTAPGAADTPPDARAAALRLAESGAEAMVRAAGPGALVDRDGAHILRWELPFLFGHLPEALAALEGEIRAVRESQHPDGGWRFGAKEGPTRTLGRVGDSVSGLSSHNAWMLLRHARVTGDEESLRAGLKALRFIERFRVPRGASLWECPIYEPDILAAAWTLPACLEAWRATGDSRWLNDAVYWAESSLPFVYLWALPDRAAMLGASLPIFGTTFYTHSWLATPVQWEGLTLAFHLRRLADELEEVGRPTAAGSPLRLALDFGPADWRRLAELLTASGQHQQVAEAGPRRGTYPDSITDFVRPNPVFLHPENLVANLLYARGPAAVPDIRTARLPGRAAVRDGCGPAGVEQVGHPVLRVVEDGVRPDEVG
ncbi:MAG TPA: hypothetical protein VM490_11700, partial [Armatimonadaceae bacterium]|nr:hypothetical protein [Armatimonadaceae bacterium]